MARKKTQTPDAPTVTREDLLRYRGDGWRAFGELGDAGWRALYEQPEVSGSPTQAAVFMGLPRTSASSMSTNFRRLGLRTVRAKQATAAPAATAETGLGDTAAAVHKLLQSSSQQHSLETLSDKLDCGVGKIRSAVEELRQACYEVDIANTDRVVLRRSAAPQGQPIRTGWADHKLRFGYVSDTHFENLCCARDELEGIYDFFAHEGVSTVLHSGDLSDGPGCRGFPGHSAEVVPICQTAYTCADYIVENYPRRDGITTHFIESAKSHAGWEFSRSGFNLGRAVHRGFTEVRRGPLGDEYVRHPGREDMRFLGQDAATLLVGPEQNTRIALVHPDGGTAYALSYQPQKWAESLEGGSKPHLALLGHYHKLNWIRERNIQVLTGECVCWQTPFMARKRIAAHVGFFLLELTVDADGTIRSFMPWEFPFFLHERRVFSIAEVA